MAANLESSLTKQTSKRATDVTKNAFDLAAEVKSNFNSLMQEWTQLRDTLKEDSLLCHRCECQASSHLAKNRITVSKQDLERLTTETMQLKEFLPKVLSTEYIGAFAKLNAAESEIVNLEKNIDKISNDVAHWQSRYQNTLSQYEQEKEDKFATQCELSELNKQLSEQSEYCASLGSAICTLLWRVSKHEDSIQLFLVGSKVDEFLVMVHHTLESYIATYHDELPEEDTDEAQFVLALSGIITNIAASAYGRDFLVTNSNGQILINTMTSILSQTPITHSAKLRNLILMCLYNISINQKGLKYILSIQGMIPLLAWLVTEEKESDNQLHTLKVIQSLIIEPDNIEVIHQVNEVLPVEKLEKFAKSRHPDLKEIAVELLMDLKSVI
ncbi:heat shock factor 2-binding protein-like [Saccoglossus kowalevskii]